MKNTKKFILPTLGQLKYIRINEEKKLAANSPY